MKTFKLWVHQKSSFNGDELVINSKEFPEVKIGNIVEIYHPDEDSNRLLLQVTSQKDDFQQKETISIEQSVASAFQLRNYQDVVVNVVPLHTVSLDLVELCFKDQYFSRSDMWRLAKTLAGSCVYQGKKIVFSEMRVIVSEIWCKGERMTCGYITEDTKVVYRSSSSVINIFIQMSHEMWEFDAVGDLYFEKANEFLKVLFAKWSEKNCCHDVTIVMFSRTFYLAECKEDFPVCMRDCVQEDYMGRFYEDFYRVIAQNERLDEWTSMIIELKRYFVSYREKVLKVQCTCGFKHSTKMIDSYNSTAAQGNFLEVINMSLNVFENFNIDRNFDRTGKIAMVITPGAGVFEVNRELTNVTKQRTIDNGIGMDIVCMAEQPLHVVPLFKYHSKADPLSFEVGDDYSLPHWINISFYQSTSQLQISNSSSFVPRIKFGMKESRNTYRDMPVLPPSWSVLDEQNDSHDNFPFTDFDEYDARVFKSGSTFSLKNSGHGKRYNSSSKSSVPQSLSEAFARNSPRHRTVSDDFRGLTQTRVADPISPIRSKLASDDSVLTNDPNRSASQESLLDSDTDSSSRFIVGSAGSVGNKFIRSRKGNSGIERPTRALINPFAPARMNFKVTSNRRRWIHAFPMDPKGTTIRQHCYWERYTEDKNERCPAPNVVEAAQLAVEARKRTRLESGSEIEADVTRSSSGNNITPNNSSNQINQINQVNQVNQVNQSLNKSSSSHLLSRHSETSLSGKKRAPVSCSRRMQQIKRDWNNYDSKPGGWFFGPTGESEWSPSLTLGVDWKSLCIPAHLPVTTDYFPDEETLKKYCLFPAYSLIPDDIYPEINLTMEVEKRGVDACSLIFKELISQRLAQGFQLISEDRILVPLAHAPGRYSQGPRNEVVEYKMSIGTIFHTLTFDGKEIKVTRYNPMHSVKPIEITYRFKLHAPDAEFYEPCVTTFANQQLEKFNWNYLDHYICSMGEGDYGLLESFKFWRSRFFLLPAVNNATKKILEGSERCDVYMDRPAEEINQLYAGFLRFMETLNKIRRPAPTRKPRPRKVCVPKKPNHTQDTSDIKPEGRGRVRHPSVPAKLQNEGVESSNNKPNLEGRRSSIVAAALLSQTSVDSAVGTDAENANTLNHNSSLTDIINVMMDAVEGLSFLPSQSGLPQYCFVASEAVTWVECCVEGVTTSESAILLLQRMIENKLVCHASGDYRRPFVQGFVFYKFVTESKSEYVDRESLIRFQNDWCEVELDKQQDTKPGSVPAFLLPVDEVSEMNIWRKTQGLLNYRQVNVDVDPNNKSDRKEWAVAQYHTKYKPDSPFSLEIQWMVATGCILGDLVYSYFRKASSCNYHLLPVPVDQFALPESKTSDPLRVPIFIPLKLRCLKIGDQGLFDEFSSDTIDHLRRLQLFQHAILKRFGFLFDAYSANKSTTNAPSQDAPLKYVHCSGSIFVLIPDYPAHEKEIEANKDLSPNRRRYSIHSNFVARRGSHDHSDRQAGFLWAWNYMLSKRWRSSNTGDENFQDKMLADFRKFCDNDDDRLKNFWDDCWLKYKENKDEELVQDDEPNDEIIDDENGEVNPSE